MRRFLVLACVACLPATSLAAQGQLVDQQVVGAKRLCIYEDARPTPVTLSEPRRNSVEIGRGEPCPFRYPRPRMERRPGGTPVSTGGVVRPNPLGQN